MNANIKKNQMTRNILGMYMDYLENIDTLRIPRPKYNKDGTPKEDKYYKDIKKELMKLVPEQFKISLLPAFFNHIDGERIGTVIRDTATEFLENTPKKVMFSVGVKVFPYNSEVNSVRVVLVKLHALDGAVGDEDGKSSSSSKKSKRSKSKKSDKGSQKGDKEEKKDTP